MFSAWMWTSARAAIVAARELCAATWRAGTSVAVRQGTRATHVSLAATTMSAPAPPADVARSARICPVPSVACAHLASAATPTWPVTVSSPPDDVCDDS